MSNSKKHDLLYIMNPSCGWCTKANPIVDELIEDGYKITTLNVKDSNDNKRAAKEIEKYSVKCGTPLFLDAETGNVACGFKPKDVLEKWAKGESIPVPQPQANKEIKNMERLVRLDYVWLGEDNVLQTKTRYDKIDFGDESAEEKKGISFDELFEQIPNDTITIDDEDVKLKPVKLYPNPLGMPPGGGNQRNSIISYVIYCELFNLDNTPHTSNERYGLRSFVGENDITEELSATQQYMFWDPIAGWPSTWKWDSDSESGETPDKDKNYQCGVGINTAPHRPIAEMHSQICLQSGLHLHSYSSENMKSQWSYSILPLDLVTISDELVISRYILERVAEIKGVGVNFERSPVENWNESFVLFAGGEEFSIGGNSNPYGAVLNSVKESAVVA